MGVDARLGPVREECFCTHIIVSSRSLGGDHVREREQRFYFLMSFKKVHTRNCSCKEKKLFFQILQVRWQTLL